MIEVLVTVLSGILIAAVSSLITVHLSIGKFRKEKWWERKADAYANVLEALHHSKEFTDHHLNADMKGREVPPERDAELRAKSKEAYAEIRRVANIGSFLMSEEAMARLTRLRKEEDEASETTHWDEYLDASWRAISTCLDDFIKIAKTDLKV